MFKPVKVMDIDLGSPLENIEGLEMYGAVKGLVRLHGTPIGYITLPLSQGRCSATNLGDAIINEHGQKIIRLLLRRRLAKPWCRC